MLTGESSILKQTAKAKEQTEIAEEKEQLQLTMTSLKFENETDLLKRKEKFIDNLDNENADVYINGEGYTVNFKKSNRIYTIHQNGKIEEEDFSILKFDEHPGQMETKIENEETIYIINSIEDLVELSENYNTYVSKHIELGKSLDFKSELSYVKALSTDYGDINQDGTISALMVEMQSGIGFTPISLFTGIFDGKNYKILNIYENRDGNGGFFGEAMAGAKISNLTITGEITASGCIGGVVAVVGHQNGNVEIHNCINYINIHNNNKTYTSFTYVGVGGIVGMGTTVKLINECTNYGNINCDNSASWLGGAGGICGGGRTGPKLVNNCINYGNIDIADGGASSGISGRAVDIINSANYGDIKKRSWN